MVAPAAAAAAYGAMWALDPSDDFVQGLFEVFSLLQVVAGLIAFGWAARRSLRSPEPDSFAMAGSDAVAR